MFQSQGPPKKEPLESAASVRQLPLGSRAATAPLIATEHLSGCKSWLREVLSSGGVAGFCQLTTQVCLVWPPQVKVLLRRGAFVASSFGTPLALLKPFADVGGGFMWPLLAYFVLVIVVVTSVLVVSYLLGPRHSEPATGEPYEGGIVSEGSARVRFSVRYYLIAAFFVVFDLEAVFLFAWAVAARESGWAGYWEVLLFVGVLLATLIYLWKVGALDWVRPRSVRASN